MAPNPLHPHTVIGDSAVNGAADHKPIILHLGDDIQYDKEMYKHLCKTYTVKQPRAEDLEREAFIKNLQRGKWGDFAAILRPFWATGNNMKPWDRTLIDLLPPKMKVMASAGAGYDWVDDKALAERGIYYCNGARASTEAVADMALFFVIGVFRNMPWSLEAGRSGNPKEWQKAHDGVPPESHNPRGFTLGIVGFGSIGYAIAEKVKSALGMKIIYHDPYRKSESEERAVEATYYEDVNDLYPVSDCILIAAPHQDRPILDAATISRLPQGARVVNIARGSLVDESALADALESRHISAAALDVHQNEPHVNVRLSRMQNVMLTSHTGGGSVETIKGFEKLAMENVDQVLQGLDPVTPVNMRFIQSRNHVNGTRKHGLSDKDEGLSAKRRQPNHVNGNGNGNGNT